MHHILETKAYLDNVRAILEQGHTEVPVPVSGNSMVPFLHPGDTVYLCPISRPLKRGDVVLYTRPDGRYILHRIIALPKDGSVIMLGDAQTLPEPIASRTQLCAIATAALRKGRPITPKNPIWAFYRFLWRWAAPWRRSLFHLWGKIRKKR